MRSDCVYMLSSSKTKKQLAKSKKFAHGPVGQFASSSGSDKTPVALFDRFLSSPEAVSTLLTALPQLGIDLHGAYMGA